jgi:hypothetical protein
MINKQFFKDHLTPLMKQNNIYLDFIGIYDDKENELFSICFEKYNSSFDINYVNSFLTMENLKNKILKENGQLGRIKSFFMVYEDFSFNVEKLEEYLILIILKPEFDNFAFLRYLRKEIHDLILKSKN